MKLPERDHYNYSAIQPYHVCVDWKLGTELHNVIKYICRRHRKDTFESNQEKWQVYLGFAVQRGGDLLVGPPNTTEFKPWQIELAWELEEGTEEHDIFWAVYDCVRAGGDVGPLKDVYERVTKGFVGDALQQRMERL